jgi:hypothetical protein
MIRAREKFRSFMLFWISEQNPDLIGEAPTICDNGESLSIKGATYSFYFRRPLPAPAPSTSLRINSALTKMVEVALSAIALATAEESRSLILKKDLYFYFFSGPHQNVKMVRAFTKKREFLILLARPFDSLR